MGEHAINLSIRYFGQLTEIAHVAVEEIPYVQGETLAQLIERIKELHPGFHTIQISAAINGQMATLADLIQINDHIDFFPPFAGG